MAMGKIFKGGEKVAKKTISKSQKAKTTTDVKVQAAAADAEKIKGKGKQVSTTDGALFFKNHGEKLTFKNFTPRQAKAFMKAAKVEKIKQVNKIEGAPIKTPTGTKYKRKNPVKEQSKESIREETRKGRVKRAAEYASSPEGAPTTVIGEGASSDVKPTRQALKAAKKESERREPKSEFMSRLSQMASSGGVEMPRNFSKPKDPKATPDQIRDAMRGKINLEPEEMDNLSAEDLIKVYEAGRTNQKNSGGMVGHGKSLKGYGKALMRSCGGSIHNNKRSK